MRTRKPSKKKESTCPPCSFLQVPSVEQNPQRCSARKSRIRTSGPPLRTPTWMAREECGTAECSTAGHTFSSKSSHADFSNRLMQRVLDTHRKQAVDERTAFSEVPMRVLRNRQSRQLLAPPHASLSGRSIGISNGACSVPQPTPTL
ncbi:hypothetical protein TcCL_ESM12359, partial [Trypanosoma cruzi]